MYNPIYPSLMSMIRELDARINNLGRFAKDKNNNRRIAGLKRRLINQIKESK